MGAINSDISQMAKQLFDRLNTQKVSEKDRKKNTLKEEVLDKTEIANAKAILNELGISISIFDQKVGKKGISESDFIFCYQKASNSDVELEEKTKQVHIKFLQVQYQTSEVPGDGESISDFEARLSNQAALDPNIEDKIEANRMYDDLEEPFEQSELDEIAQILQDYKNDNCSKEDVITRYSIARNWHTEAQIKEYCPEFYKLVTGKE